MELFFQILFWTCIFAIFHSYMLFPFILKLLAKNKFENSIIFKTSDDLPSVSVLMSLYNEEEVISEKIKSIYASSYPSDKLEIIIGSDNSSDNTNNLVIELSSKYSNLHFFEFNTRQGKPNVINQLFTKATGNILVLTDANVMLDKNTIFELVKHFKNEKIGLSDSRMINTKESISIKGISVQESSYISREVEIKKNEGKLWGTMMGPFGGCYAIRKELYSIVPENFLVDDFFINMSVLAQNKMAVNNKDAIVYEDVSDNIKEEFRRKIRISTGNFQNLSTFFKLLFSKRKGLSFCFLSHKVLRWLGPFFILFALCLNIILSDIILYKYILFIFLFTFIIPAIDNLFKLFKINLPLIRYFTHFYGMNSALLIGFFKFISGVKSGIWQPTGRNQAKSKYS